MSNGYWEEPHIEDDGECYAFCSVCGEDVDMDENGEFPRVCPKCGARMDGDGDA